MSSPESLRGPSLASAVAVKRLRTSVMSKRGKELERKKRWWVVIGEDD